MYGSVLWWKDASGRNAATYIPSDGSEGENKPNTEKYKTASNIAVSVDLEIYI